MRWPLRNQILLPMVVVMLGVLLCVTLLNVYLSVSQTQRQIERQLRDVARTLSQSSFPLTDAVLAQMRGLSGAEYLLTDREGTVIASSDRAAMAKRPLPAAAAPEGPQIRLDQTVLLGERRYYHAEVALKRSTGPERDLRLHILYPESSYADAWRQAAYPPLAIGAVGLALVVLLAGLIAARVGGPLSKLRRQAEGIAAGKFEPLPLPARNDEIRDLAQGINRMSEMLAVYEDKVRRTEQLRTLGQLGGGIAHQLRNSVTGCRMALDLHRRECPLRDDGESLEVAIRQLTLMENFIRRLLSKSPADAAAHTPVDLAELVQATLPLLKPAANHVHVSLDALSADGPTVVLGDEHELEQLLVNLVLNAIDAAARRDEPVSRIEPVGRNKTIGRGEKGPPAARTVRVALRDSAENRVIIEVQDSGRGPDPGIRDRLFEPLVTSKPDGTGLGLSIAEDIVRRHGGAIHWQQRDGLTCFVVDLPRHATEESCVQTAGG